MQSIVRISTKLIYLLVDIYLAKATGRSRAGGLRNFTTASMFGYAL
jgi:hypothetical protein